MRDGLNAVLRCPECQTGALRTNGSASLLQCVACSAQFPISSGRPVLLRSDNSLFRVQDYLPVPVKPPISRLERGLSRFVPRLSVNLASARVLEKLRRHLSGASGCRVLVVGGGQQRHWLDQRLGVSESLQVYYSDIDVTADVDLICDGHELPFIDCCFDAVITTAVLEHVLYPEQVAREIQRVLKVSGFIYSELPFMQQVHEGAYDFTRYTLSGHRRLFNQIAELDSGMVAGPATTLAWSIENFALALAGGGPRSAKLIKAGVRICFGWLKYVDYMLANRPQAMDGASCTYLFGQKINGQIADADIISRYVGGKHIQHT